MSLKGYSATKMADIASEAGIGKGTVYEYFRSKEEIFFTLYERLRKEFHGRVFKEDTALPPDEKIKRFLLNALSALQQWKDMSRVLLDFWAEHRAGTGPDFRFEELYTVARQRLASIIREGIRKGVFRKVNAHYTASLLIGIVDGLMLQWVFSPERFPLTKVASQAVDVILEGLKK